MSEKAEPTSDMLEALRGSGEAIRCSFGQEESELPQFVLPKYREVFLGEGRVYICGVTGVNGEKGIAFTPVDESHPIGKLLDSDDLGEAGLKAGEPIDPTREDITIIWMTNWDSAKVFLECLIEIVEKVRLKEFYEKYPEAKP